MSNKDEPETDLEKRTRSAYRALSGDSDGDVNFGQGGSLNDHAMSRLIRKNKRVTARLPMPEQAMPIEQQGDLRGASDRAALFRKYHDDLITGDQNTPEGQGLFNIFEQVRCETLGSHDYKGVGKNLIDAMEKYVEDKGYNPDDKIPIEDGLYVLTFEVLSGLDLGEKSKSISKIWHTEIEQRLGYGAFLRMALALENQKKFADAANIFIKDLLENDDSIIDSTRNDAPSDDDKTPQEEEQQSSESTEEPDQSPDQKETQDDKDLKSPIQDILNMDKMQAELAEEQANGDDDSAANQAEPPMPKRQDAFTRRDALYSAYTTTYDENIDASKLADASELIQLRQQLDTQLVPLQTLIAKLANRLQRLLMTKQERRWDFDVEDGTLNTNRFASMIADPNIPARYKKEVDSDFKHTVLTILIDNSGSMRGRPITVAALTTDILAKVLERSGVKVEILGFTTANWKGGQSRTLWTKQNRAPKPGRLNDIRHIIYKSADKQFRCTKNNLGLMLKEGILKENIDGEALLWAYNRIRRRNEDRKIIMVISDGAPVDDSTLSANGSGYLEQDLHRVIDAVEGRRDVELMAVGIGHDVGKYYKNAITIRDATDLPTVMMNELAKMFG